MTRVARATAVGLLAVVVASVTANTSTAQPRDTLPGLSGNMSPVEIQRLFDAYEVVRAQEMLDLSDDQYPNFVTALTRFQQRRRTNLRNRQRQLRELQRLSTQANTDDATLTARLEAFRRHDADSAHAEREAVAAIDAVLTVRQQVRFRVFQQAMERRRVDLLMRARRQPSRRDQDQTPPR